MQLIYQTIKKSDIPASICADVSAYNFLTEV